jgi:aspartate/methionine/tyrosine aminotransferase
MPLPPFILERYFARHEFGAKHQLCCSDCESLSIGELLSLEPEARERFERHWLGYTETQGSQTLRGEICRLYRTIRPDDVLVHAGAEEAIFLFMHAALGAGDHIVVHAPCYQSLAEVARGLGCQVTPWQAWEEKGWALDLEELRGHLRPNTRAVILNTPHNPTGYLMPRETLQALSGLCQERGILLFSDEVYRELEHNPADRLPAACDLGEHAVSLGVMSKAYGLAGLRIGWVATRNAALLARMAELKDYTTICASAPSEFLAELALRHGATLVERNRRIIAANLAVLDGFFAAHPDRFVWRRPGAGPIAFPRLVGEDVDVFCDVLLEQAGILLLPGSVYGDAGNHFRIGFGRKNLPEAVARLEAFLREHR